MFEVSTLGQPFEVIKTHLAANRNDSMLTALKKTYKRGGFLGGFSRIKYHRAWIEASTKVYYIYKIIHRATDVNFNWLISN